MNLKRFTDKAKDTLEKRGGVDGLKRDVASMREAAAKPGSFKEKAMATKDALVHPAEDDAHPDPHANAPEAAPLAEDQPLTPPASSPVVDGTPIAETPPESGTQA